MNHNVRLMRGKPLYNWLSYWFYVCGAFAFCGLFNEQGAFFFEVSQKKLIFLLITSN